VYPVVLRLEGRRCLVVGGGEVARRKADGLLAAGAVVTVVAPDVDAALQERAADPDLNGRLTVEPRRYRPDDLAGAWLAVAATDDPDVQQAVFDDGERAGVWVNAADDPDRCAVFLPAVHRRGPVIVAVSTQGTSPALAGWLRDRLAAALPARLEELAAVVAAERRALRVAGRSTEDVDWQTRIAALANRLDDLASRPTGVPRDPGGEDEEGS
jgi:precorrin-2 dehydrogenase/sirohydrochlorin ferrochelatase